MERKISTSDALATPRGSSAIVSYHAHVYWGSPEERATALRIREWLGERFGVAMGRVHDQPVGPHTQPMYQVAFTPDVLTGLLPWLLLNRHGLSVLVHPNTGWARDDHLLHSLWLGIPLPLLGERLPNDPGTDDLAPPVTKPLPAFRVNEVNGASEGRLRPK